MHSQQLEGLGGGGDVVEMEGGGERGDHQAAEAMMMTGLLFKEKGGSHPHSHPQQDSVRVHERTSKAEEEEEDQTMHVDSLKMAEGLCQEEEDRHRHLRGSTDGRPQQDSVQVGFLVDDNWLARRAIERRKNKAKEKKKAKGGLSDSKRKKLMRDFRIGEETTPADWELFSRFVHFKQHPPGYDTEARIDAFFAERAKLKPVNPDHPSDYFADSDTESNPYSDLFDPFWSYEDETYIPKGRMDFRKSFPLFSGVEALQVFSVKLKRCDIYTGENGQVVFYGNIRARDDEDWKRNYLFQRQANDCMALKLEETLPLSGPCRGISCCSMICLEFNLNATGNEQTKSKPICKDVLNLEPGDNFPMRKILTKTLWGKYGAVEMRYAMFDDATEATVEVKIMSGRRDGLRGKIAAHIAMSKYGDTSENNSLAENEIVLFDSKKFGKSITCDDATSNIELWCSVLVVPKNGHLDLRVSLDSCDDGGPDVEEEEVVRSFYPEKETSFAAGAVQAKRKAWTDTAEPLQFKAVTLEAKVSWSSLLF